MDKIALLFESIGTPLVVGVLLAYFQHVNDKRYKKMDKRAEARKKEGEVVLGLAEANAKLSYAVAMAYKRGEPNGEIEEGIKAYKKAMKDRDNMLKESHAEYVNER